jgi:hypothetical protein
MIGAIPDRMDTGHQEETTMLRMREDFTNETEGHFISEGTDWYEPYTDNRKRLFREC